MRPSFAMILLMGVLIVGQGCQAIGVAATVISGPPVVPAQYDMPDKPTLILIEDPSKIINDDAMLRRVAANASAALEAENVVTTGIVGQDELAAYRAKLGKDFRNTSLAALAMHFDAKQVIHGEVVAYQMDVGGGVVRPLLAINVKVFDLDARDRVFPVNTDPETGVDVGQPTYPLVTKRFPQDLNELGAARTIAKRDLANEAGRDLGRLFFDWRRPQPGADVQR